ncbi:endonuclease [Sphingomonas gilva]|uniref:Endonuclease n=1 Tax=Sphingomonas gilva TaxID=2305907 RepID=A0A396RMW5_9SPHN|nr:endonuclease [Sphingomonas gilva]RHW17797.1 endonuclease [Sphingomonas gilva]
MQGQFAFVSNDIARWRSRLTPLLVGVEALPRRTPVGQLVKSLISGRTRDPVSLAAYRRLGARFGSAAGIAAATPIAVERVIADVTFAAAKAEWLVEALRLIGRERPDWRLGFLGGLPLGEALGWLERLPGVGRKVAASTLNASTLARPVLIVDSHVLRVLGRLGLVATHAEAEMASEIVTAAMPGWNADDFLRFHIALKRLGQTVCRFETPACAACPLASDCPSNKPLG